MDNFLRSCFTECTKILKLIIYMYFFVQNKMNIDKIKLFCETQDTQHLKHLSRKHEILLQRLAVLALKLPNSKHDVAQQILEYYQLDSEGKRVNLKDRGLVKVQSILNSMSVALTGARAGDILVGRSKGTKGAVMRIHGGDVPPQRRTLDSLRYYPDIWCKFLVRLGSIPFFSEMDIVARDIWLDLNEAGDENSIGQEGARLQITQPGVGDFVSKLSEEDLDMLIQGNPESEDGYWSYEEVENMIPAKAGSMARRHTLILIRSFWGLAIDYEVVDEFDGLVIDLANGVLMRGVVADTVSSKIYILGSISKNVVQVTKNKQVRWERSNGQKGVQDVGIFVSNHGIQIRNIDSIVSEIHAVNFDKIRASFKNFTGASYKSLLQKIIRFRPEQVDLGGYVVSAPEALLVCMADLASHPGAFIPDIQRYVTGMESFCKRLAVTIFEDSSLPDQNNTLFSLLSGALLTQRVRSWLPTRELLKLWFLAGITAWKQLLAVDVEYKAEISRKPYVLTYGQDVLQSASAVLDELRSFSTDLGLARGWARDYPDWKIQIAQSSPDVMPLEHCVDQHWAPGVAHYFNPAFVNITCEGHTSGQPFAQLFNKIWDASSGINPRRTPFMDFKTFEEDSDVREIRNAQHLFLVALQNVPRMRPHTGKNLTLKYTLPDSWIAGLVGAIEVKPPKHPHMLVTLSGDDPLNLVVIRRPSRNMSPEVLPSKSEEVAKEIVKQRLRMGVAMNKAHPPFRTLKNTKVYLIDREDEEPYYAISSNNGPKIAWDVAKHLQITVPEHSQVSGWSVEYALTHSGDGIEKDADKSLDELVSHADKAVLRRVLVYITTYDHTIEMNRISRDGGGTYKAVLLEDVPAYQFMLRLSSLYPSALQPNGPSKFDIPIAPILWILRSRIAKAVSTVLSVFGWNNIRFRDDKRDMWPHQKDMVDDMVRNRREGNKGNFLWVPVGLGKSYAVMGYLQYLKENFLLPQYVIYTLPESAIRSIIKEIKYF